MHDKVKIRSENVLPWGLRILMAETEDESMGMAQLIIQEVNMRKVYWCDLPDFIKSMMRDKEPYKYGMMLADEKAWV